MSLVEFLILLLIAGICGAVAQSLTGFTRGGCLVAIAIGFVGAYLGAWLARELGFPLFFVISVGGEDFPIIWSVIGGALFAAVIGFLTTRRR